MSMPLVFHALTAEQVAAWRQARTRKAAADARDEAEARSAAKITSAANDWSDVLGGGDEHPDDVLEAAADMLEMDSEHFGLSYLMQRAAGLDYKLADLTYRVFGRDLGIGNNPDGTIHNTVALNQDDLAEGLVFLRSLDERALRAAYEPRRMALIGIHPTSAWAEPSTLETLLDTFHAVRSFFERALGNGHTIVVQIAI
jgi:hypothetical protein